MYANRKLVLNDFLCINIKYMFQFLKIVVQTKDYI